MLHHLLNPVRLQELARQWILEDTSSFDFAGSVATDSICEFSIYIKSCGMLAGVPFANAVFEELGLTSNWIFLEGSFPEPITEVAVVVGPARKLLIAERITLNILCRASGIATLTSKMKSMLSNAKWEGILAATRKTTPGFRMVEKYAVLVGGGDMHRYDLSGMVMLKDNHISLCKSVAEAVENTRKLCGFSCKIEVECRSLEEAIKAGQAGCDVVMLDNFIPEALWTVAERIKSMFPSILIEASGGITEDNVCNYCNSFIDIISTSRLVQGYPVVDFSMKTKKTLKNLE